MNIVCIHTHDTGRMLQPYGFAVPTPNFMLFAQQAALFRNAYCAGPTCSPSRAALLTGRTPHSCGQFGLAHRGFSMPDYSGHLASYLRTAGGFETVLCGIQHEAPDAAMLGYSRILGDREYDMGNVVFDSVTFDRANADSVCEYLAGDHEKPFFLSFGLFNTHRPYPQHPDSMQTAYLQPFPFFAPTEENREDMANFQYSVQVADECFGRVLNALEANGLRENTMVIFTTDHGVALPGHKCTLSDGGTGVALLVDYPGNRLRGCVTDALVSHLDLYPTLCELCGVPAPDALQGVSLVPLLTRQAENVRDSVFFEVNFHTCYEPQRGLRTERYKYICRYEDALPVLLTNIDDCPEKALLLAQGALSQPHVREELYDLLCDPLEQQNLCGKPAYEDLRQNLAGRLGSWMRLTDDSLLQGSIQPPPGVALNQRDGISAQEPVYHVQRETSNCPRP